MHVQQIVGLLYPSKGFMFYNVVRGNALLCGSNPKGDYSTGREEVIEEKT